MTKITSYFPLPECLTIKPSKLHGLGLFATTKIPKGAVLGTTHVIDNSAKDGLIRTPLGGFINHSYSPNVRIIEGEETWVLISEKEIEKGEELTIDYTPYYTAEALKNYN